MAKILLEWLTSTRPVIAGKYPVLEMNSRASHDEFTCGRACIQAAIIAPSTHGGESNSAFSSRGNAA
jgi:hypothetical protein